MVDNMDQLDILWLCTWKGDLAVKLLGLNDLKEGKMYWKW